MDQNDHQNLKNLSQLTKSQILKKITPLLVSVSVFSLVLSKSSSLSFLHPFNFYFSTFPFQLFSHTINKNCIFLLCNGLLVFVAKYSGLISSSSTYNYTSIDQSLKNYEDSTPLLVLEPKLKLLEKEVLVESVAVQEKLAGEEGRENEYECMVGQVEDGETEEFVVEDEEKRESGLLIIGKEGEESEVCGEEDDGQEEKELDNEFPIQREEEEGEEEEEEAVDEGIEVLSTEELNKKFDEFIRKMKEEIRIEAQQQLVMVN